MSDGTGVSLGAGGGGSVGRSVLVGTGVSDGAMVGIDVRVSVAVRVGRGVGERSGVLTGGRRGTHSLCPVYIVVDVKQLAVRSCDTVVPVARAMRVRLSPDLTV